MTLSGGRGFGRFVRRSARAASRRAGRRAGRRYKRRSTHSDSRLKTWRFSETLEANLNNGQRVVSHYIEDEARKAEARSSRAFSICRVVDTNYTIENTVVVEYDIDVTYIVNYNARNSRSGFTSRRYRQLNDFVLTFKQLGVVTEKQYLKRIAVSINRNIPSLERRVFEDRGNDPDINSSSAVEIVDASVNKLSIDGEQELIIRGSFSLECV